MAATAAKTAPLAAPSPMVVTIPAPSRTIGGTVTAATGTRRAWNV
jgi:hypothetical protein